MSQETSKNPISELGNISDHDDHQPEQETWLCPLCKETLVGEVKVCPNCFLGKYEKVPISPPIQKKEKPLMRIAWIVSMIIVVCLGTGVLGWQIVRKGGLFTTSTSNEEPLPTSSKVSVEFSSPKTSPTEEQPLKSTSVSVESPLPKPSLTHIPTSTSIPPLGIGTTQISQKDGMVMVYVPEGWFDMGSIYGEVDEKPVHSVYLDAFWIDRTEVTNEMYAEFLNDMGNHREGGVYWLDIEDQENDERIIKQGGRWVPKSGYNNHPVIEVSWYGAHAYCEWASRRLPTEAEWEKAAQGTDRRIYPWGDAFHGKYLNYCDSQCPEDWRDDEYNDGYVRTSPVGSFPLGASPFGALDMAGNVYEFVEDWMNMEINYYAISPESNPQGPKKGNYNYKIHRGGSWWSKPLFVRTANRGYTGVYDSDDNVGFRCALSY